ncbi:MAG: hypothetical protein MUC67_12765 [Acidobacteria bacterium]|nr:hypothetical protein [Acidobacteriota bacterium]
MRLPIAVAALLALSGPGAEAAGNGAWTSLPDGTATVFLGTGGDTGFIKPKGCQGRMGGALYRAGWVARSTGRPSPNGSTRPSRGRSRCG